MAKRKITLDQDLIADLANNPSACSFRRRSAIGCSAIESTQRGKPQYFGRKSGGFQDSGGLGQCYCWFIDSNRCSPEEMLLSILNSVRGLGVVFNMVSSQPELGVHVGFV